MSAREITRRRRRVNSGLARAFAAAAAMLAAATVSAQADPFASALNDAVARGDRRAVAAMARYPLRVLAGGLPIPVADAAMFVRMYDTLISPETRCDLERKPVVRTASGVSMGGGVLWAEAAAGGDHITRMTVSASSTKLPAKPVERVMFRAALPSTRQLAGTLQRDEVWPYVLYAKQGQELQVRLSGFRGRDVVMRVTNPATRAPLESRSPADGRSWSGAIPATGDYRVDVIRRAPYCDPLLTYNVAFTLR